MIWDAFDYQINPAIGLYASIFLLCGRDRVFMKMTAFSRYHSVLKALCFAAYINNGGENWIFFEGWIPGISVKVDYDYQT